MADRTEILNRLFTNVEQYMLESVHRNKNGAFSNIEIGRRIVQDQREAYIELLVACDEREQCSPFMAARQMIGRRLLAIAYISGYRRAPELDQGCLDIFNNPTDEIFYRPVMPLGALAPV